MFLSTYVWQIDTPPGTSDEHLSIVQYLKSTGVDGAVVVTTPQEVSPRHCSVRRSVKFDVLFAFGVCLRRLHC